MDVVEPVKVDAGGGASARVPAERAGVARRAPRPDVAFAEGLPGPGDVGRAGIGVGADAGRVRSAFGVGRVTRRSATMQARARQPHPPQRAAHPASNPLAILYPAQRRAR